MNSLHQIGDLIKQENGNNLLAKKEKIDKKTIGGGINNKYYGELVTRNLYHVLFSDIEIKDFEKYSTKLNLNNKKQKNSFMKEITKAIKTYEEDYEISKKIDVSKITDGEILKSIKKIQNRIEHKISSLKEIVYNVNKKYEEKKKKYEEENKLFEGSEIKVGDQFLGKVKDFNLEKSLLTINFGKKYRGGLFSKNTLEGQKNQKIETSRLTQNTIQVEVTGMTMKGVEPFYYLKEVPLTLQEIKVSTEKSPQSLEEKIINYILPTQSNPSQNKPYRGVSLDDLCKKFGKTIKEQYNITEPEKIRKKLHAILEKYQKNHPEKIKKDYYLPEGSTYKDGIWELPQGEKPILYYTIINKNMKKTP